MSTRKRTGTEVRNHSTDIEDGYLPEKRSDIKGDEKNIAILFFLYLLQGIPIGLTAAIPMYLRNRGVSYRQQAEFSFAHWPFSLKLLWAPIVDSVFSTRFGRRKSWLVPTQYLIGFFMMFLSANVEHWLEGESAGTNGPSTGTLTAFFFCLNFLAATQDIAVDGWALTMLKRNNVGHASTCNSVGQTAGYFLGYVVFMGLESAEFCNAYLRSEPEPQGLVTLSGFLYFWGLVFLVTTTLVGLFKHEIPCREGNEPHDTDLGVKETYKLLWDIVRLPAVRTTIVVLLTSKIGFSACDAVTSLKLVDAGVPKEKLALIAIPLVPLQIILPLVLSKYTVGPRPMDVYLTAIPYRLLCGLIAALLVWITPSFVHDGSIPIHYYVMVIIVYGLHQVALYSMFVAVMAFFARISDPAVGGTYMTLLNTVANLGGNWPATVALWFVDGLTYKACSMAQDNNCSSESEKQACISQGGSCETVLDGYYVESAVCVVIGFLWLLWGKKRVNYLQSRGDNAWKVVRMRTR
ncbi:acetyl-coenzyme A transporter 1 [Schistocerca nitens]|uniref:acetyl-coenzyme A transporter 1 n=1 Tax=Schistocerca nitens TaxID=7011 RepID=UPI002117C4C0|nr:acetyl-coenzyme A transporter 1 [Schistocerca nitens]XP_049809606.1 acetyl-coenzyme A transporter 1 [Schistocerca nitens]XP_049809607.1 acetyl-coenzyme A transporter 1 [Schistocerca nitens]